MAIHNKYFYHISCHNFISRKHYQLVTLKNKIAILQGESKKRLLRRYVIFNPKNDNIGSSIDENKKLPSF